MQTNYSGKGAGTVGLRQETLYAVARNEGLRGAFELYLLQRCSQGISDRETCDTPRHQSYGGWVSDYSAQGGLLDVVAE
jgi:hypothetical protein